MLRYLGIWAAESPDGRRGGTGPCLYIAVREVIDKLKLVHRTTLMAFYGDVLGRRTDRRIGGIGAVLEALEGLGPSGCGRDESRPYLWGRDLWACGGGKSASSQRPFSGMRIHPARLRRTGLRLNRRPGRTPHPGWGQRLEAARPWAVRGGDGQAEACTPDYLDGGVDEPSACTAVLTHHRALR